jgi:hypothetical protein
VRARTSRRPLSPPRPTAAIGLVGLAARVFFFRPEARRARGGGVDRASRAARSSRGSRFDARSRETRERGSLRDATRRRSSARGAPRARRRSPRVVLRFYTDDWRPQAGAVGEELSLSRGARRGRFPAPSARDLARNRRRSRPRALDRAPRETRTTRRRYARARPASRPDLDPPIPRPPSRGRGGGDT